MVLLYGGLLGCGLSRIDELRKLIPSHILYSSGKKKLIAQEYRGIFKVSFNRN